MNTLPVKSFIVLCFSFLLSLSLNAQSNYASLEFTQNKGQWDPGVTYKGDLSTGSFFLRKTGFTVVQQLPADLEKIGEAVHGHAHDDGKKRPERPTRDP